VEARWSTHRVGRSVRVAAILLLTGRDGRHNPGIGSRPHGLYFPGDDANDAAHQDTTNGSGNMNTTHHRKRIIAGALLSGSLAVAGLGLTAGTAQAEHGFAPRFHGPFPADNFTEQHNWCPGQPLPMDDVVWDMGVCHHWYWVAVGGTGNVGQLVWEGDAPRQPLGPPPCYGAPICLPGL
jgi:hypothetical protein